MIRFSTHSTGYFFEKEKERKERKERKNYVKLYFAHSFLAYVLTIKHSFNYYTLHIYHTAILFMSYLLSLICAVHFP